MRVFHVSQAESQQITLERFSIDKILQIKTLTPISNFIIVIIIVIVVVINREFCEQNKIQQNMWPQTLTHTRRGKRKNTHQAAVE